MSDQPKIRLADAYMREMRNHILETVIESENVQVYNMREPGTGIFLVQLIFVPHGISIMGDFCPGRNGVCSALGYGRGWFSTVKGPGYLCEKFLDMRFVPEAAAGELTDPKGMVREYLTEDLEDESATVERLESIANAVLDDHNAHDMVESLSELGYECDDGIPGWTYSPNESAALEAINRKFAELWAQREAVPA